MGAHLDEIERAFFNAVDRAGQTLDVSVQLLGRGAAHLREDGELSASPEPPGYVSLPVYSNLRPSITQRIGILKSCL